MRLSEAQRHDDIGARAGYPEGLQRSEGANISYREIVIQPSKEAPKRSVEQ